MPKEHNFEVIEGGGETSDAPRSPLTEDDIKRRVQDAMQEAMVASWDSFAQLAIDVVTDECEHDELELIKADPAIRLSIDFMRERFSDLCAEITAMLIGSLEENEPLHWHSAVDLLSGFNTKLDQIQILFFVYAKDDRERRRKVADLVGEMKALNTLLYAEVAMRPEA
jgi:hypothetical protein